MEMDKDLLPSRTSHILPLTTRLLTWNLVPFLGFEDQILLVPSCILELGDPMEVRC